MLSSIRDTKLILIGTMSLEYAWSQIEPAAAILCACIVTYRPLFKPNKRHSSNCTPRVSHRNEHETTQSHWTDMCNNKTSPVRWAVASDFIGMEDTRNHRFGLDKPRSSPVNATFPTETHCLKPLPSVPRTAPVQEFVTSRFPVRSVWFDDDCHAEPTPPV